MVLSAYTAGTFWNGLISSVQSESVIIHFTLLRNVITQYVAGLFLEKSE